MNQTLLHLSTRQRQKSEGSQLFYLSEDTDSYPTEDQLSSCCSYSDKCIVSFTSCPFSWLQKRIFLILILCSPDRHRDCRNYVIVRACHFFKKLHWPFNRSIRTLLFSILPCSAPFVCFLTTVKSWSPFSLYKVSYLQLPALSLALFFIFHNATSSLVTKS